MQSEEQPVSDANIPAEASSPVNWPPSFWRLILAAAFTAGVGYLVLKTIHPIFIVPIEIATFPEQSPLWLYQRLDKAQSAVDSRNYSIVFGVIGAIFGASSVVFSFGARAGRAIVVAVVASAAMGVLGANLSNSMFNNMRATSGKDLLVMGVALDGMGQSIVGYSLLWCLIGFGVGLGVGSIRSAGKSLVAGISGLCGGALGAMLYVVMTAQFTIGITMNQALPFSNTSQAIWLSLFTVVIAACIALGSGEKRKKNAPEPMH